MLRLRKTLLCDYLYYLILFLTIIIVIIRINSKPKLIYESKYYQITGIIESINIDGNKLSVTIKSEEKLIGTYYYKSIREKNNSNYEIGDKIYVTGKITSPKDPTNYNTFNYHDYLYNRGIYHTMKIDYLKKINSTNNLLYKLKILLKKRLNNNAYLYTFILGDKSLVKRDVLTSYQENGISHLFATSGMHMTILSSIIIYLLKKIKVKENNRYLITSIILIFYLFITSLSPSVIRGLLFFILFSYNKIYYFYIKPVNLFIIVLSITLTINPFYIYEVSFLYSFLISFSLLLMTNFLSTGNYIYKLFKVSLISFLISIPISLYSFYQINILSIIYNLFFVPLVSLIIFPLAIITTLIPELDCIFNIFISILENTSLYLNNISIGKLVFIKLPFIVYLLYIIIIFVIFYFINKHKYKYILVLLIILLIHYSIPTFTNSSYIEALDVGQGDSTILGVKNKTILIDTGGITKYESSWQKKKREWSIVKGITIPTLKSKGISKINALIITHGDFDHMGEAINLVNNFKVEKVIFNCGEYNYLEGELIKVLNKKHIKHYSCIKELEINKNKLFFLQTNDFNNENDNSNVIYTELNGYKFMFMGDASITTEKEILKEYNLPKIDVLKVGHHGSKTSSSKEFINEINPKYSIISVGKNNRYGHPNKEVLENLKDSKIYRTDQDGSIMFKIKNNKLKNETCSP